MNTQPEDEISRSSEHVASNLHRLGLLYEHREPNGTAVSIFSAHTAHFHLWSSAPPGRRYRGGQVACARPLQYLHSWPGVGKGVDLSVWLTPDGPAYLPQPGWQLD